MGVADDGLERGQEVLAQGAFGDLRRTDIGSVLRLAVAGHVLERGVDLVGRQRQALALQPQDGGLADLAAEVRILAIGLLDPAPARIAGDIDHRRQGLHRPPRPHLPRGHGEHLAHHFRIEGGGEGDGLGEGGRVPRHITVQGLFVGEAGDAEAGLLARPALDLVHIPRGLGGGAMDRRPALGRRRPEGGRALDVRRPRHRAHAVGIARGGPGGIEVRVRGLNLSLVLPDALHLRDLLLQRHAPHQVVDTGLNGQAGVAVGRVGRRPGGGSGRGGADGGGHQGAERSGAQERAREAAARQAPALIRHLRRPSLVVGTKLAAPRPLRKPRACKRRRGG